MVDGLALAKFATCPGWATPAQATLHRFPRGAAPVVAARLNRWWQPQPPVPGAAPRGAPPAVDLCAESVELLPDADPPTAKVGLGVMFVWDEGREDLDADLILGRGHRIQPRRFP
jgi:hypothetical protein